jgi:hypothetical protein
MFPSFPHYKEGTGGRGQIEPGLPVVPPEKSQDKEKFRSARKIPPSGKPALR